MEQPREIKTVLKLEGKDEFIADIETVRTALQALKADLLDVFELQEKVGGRA